MEDSFGELFPRALPKYLTTVHCKLFSLCLLRTQGDIWVNPPCRVQSWPLLGGRMGKAEALSLKAPKDSSSSGANRGQEATVLRPLELCIGLVSPHVPGMCQDRWMDMPGNCWTPQSLWKTEVVTCEPFWFHDYQADLFLSFFIPWGLCSSFGKVSSPTHSASLGITD